MKFKLLKNDEESINLVLFKDRARSQIKEISVNDLSFKPPILKNKIIGRNREMQNLLEITTKNRVVFVYGKPGIGKTLLVKSAANYACERRMFKHGVIYLDLQGKSNSSAINTIIAQSLNIT